MDAQSFTSIASVGLSSRGRLFQNSWCPDKDLLAIALHVNGKDRLSLWKMQGAKIWEVDIERDPAGDEEIVGVAWSPDGLNIAVAHHPPLVTLHSIQDGHQERALTVTPSPTPASARLDQIWWFKELRVEKKAGIPDIFKRQGHVTGSAHSVLRTQPLLDPLHDDSKQLSATELFAFQVINSKPASAQTSIPPTISDWPTLPQDLLAASIQEPSSSSRNKRPGEELDVIDDSNVNSILLVADDSHQVHGFLDGSYPLGAVDLGDSAACSVHRTTNSTFLALCKADSTSLRPSDLRMPFLESRIVRDIAKTSSSARELTWYTMRVVKEMRDVWFGSSSHNGARELGPNWVRALERRQQNSFGIDDPNAILDLTILLATGRASESLADYLGSGEQMSERGIQKWQTSVTDALLKIRDYSSKRVAPAFQRICLLLQEVQGWSMLPQYALCRISTDDVKAAIELTQRGIVCANWLAATVRRELSHFKEFIEWLKYEVLRQTSASQDNAPTPTLKHDVLEVNEYLTSGLVVSSIDRWFMGPVPQFSDLDLGSPVPRGLDAALQTARAKLQTGLVWPPEAKPRDLSRLDRNLDSLVQELASRCSKIFGEASKAAARSAVVRHPSVRDTITPGTPRAQLVRERLVANDSGQFLQHLAMQMPVIDDQSYFCLAQVEHNTHAPETALSVSCIVLSTTVSTGDEEEAIPVALLDAEFFDDDTLIIVFRRTDQGSEQGPAYIATVRYTELVYEDSGFDGVASREALLARLTQSLSSGQIAAVPIPIAHSRELVGCRRGRVQLAVNGRVGRRVASVLDEAGAALEVLDMEPDEEDEEDEDAVEADE